LIACGLDPDLLAERGVDALRQVPRNALRGFLPWANRALFRTDPLQLWLEKQLRQAVGAHQEDRLVTFQQLARRENNIELNVVAMDLDRRQPIVFNAITTPHCSVSRSVVASCAIPLAMPPGRVVVPSSDGESMEIHRIVDGGAWANYPAFVYRDRSFREFVRLPPFDAARITLGFVIVQSAAPPGKAAEPPPPQRVPDPDAIRSARPRKSLMDKGAGRRAGRLGPILNWTLLRWAGTMLVPLIASVTMVLWLQDDTTGVFNAFRWAGYARLPTAILTVLIVGVSLVMAAAVTLFQLRFGHEIADVVFPSVIAALSVGPGVPDWVGHADDDRVIRLWPPEQIGTVNFKVAPRLAEYVMQTAARCAAPQIDHLFPDHPRSSAVRELAVRPPAVQRPLSRWHKAGLYGFGSLAVVLYWNFVSNEGLAFVLGWTYLLGGPLWIWDSGSSASVIDPTPAEVGPTYPDPRPRRQNLVTTFAMTMMLAFVLIDGVTWLEQGTFASLALVGFMLAPLLIWRLTRQILIGRARYLRLDDNHAKRQPLPWPRALWGTLSLGVGLWWFAHTPDLSQPTTHSLIFYTALVWFGGGLLISSLYWIAAGVAAKRYDAELAAR
jgi:predicted acylesterase/phospholipase RssA